MIPLSALSDDGELSLFYTNFTFSPNLGESKGDSSYGYLTISDDEESEFWPVELSYYCVFYVKTLKLISLAT